MAAPNPHPHPSQFEEVVPHAFASAEAARSASLAASRRAQELEQLADAALSALTKAEETNDASVDIEENRKAVAAAMDAAQAARKYAELVRLERLAWERTVSVTNRRRARRSNSFVNSGMRLEEMEAAAARATKEAQAATSAAKAAWRKAAKAASLSAWAAKELAARAERTSAHPVQKEVVEAQTMLLRASAEERRAHTEATVEGANALAAAAVWPMAATLIAAAGVLVIPVIAAYVMRK